MPKQKHMIEQRGAVSTVRYDVFSGWQQWYLLMADNHHDSIYCNRELEKAHLEEARRRKARILVLGDWFDAMQGRFDSRRSMNELREEYRRDDYYDFVVYDSRDFLLPYADLIDLLADGNHELSVVKNANTNLMDRLVSHLNEKAGTHIQHGGFGGWYRMMFHNLTDPESTGGNRSSLKMKYFHGAGGEAPVTRGAIQTNRQAVYLPDADFVVNGHNHNSYYIPISRERLGDRGSIYFDIQHHIRVPGYKQAYGDGSTGWEVTRGGVPKPIGCVWMRLYYDLREIKVQVTPDVCGGEAVNGVGEMYGGKVWNEDGEGQ